MATISGQEAARALIDKIRREMSPDGESIASFMRESLTLLAKQLYNTSTHFLLELLQNADDNHYDKSVTPTLCITHQPGSLRIDCNEVGFTDKNVKAICTIGKSTKSKSDSFIGEKGIGFKSVFKVAEAVWISSGDYSFKFDTREEGELGMIAPRWDDFPEPIRAGYTSIYLKLFPKRYERELEEQITSFDTTMLMFLRKLKQIELKVIRSDGTVWSELLRKEEQKEHNLSLTVLHSRDVTTKYVIKKHTATELPPEPKRPSCSQSEIALAFPVFRTNGNPPIKSHKVYAFLPIRDYGFKFMVQADFLLTANREDIDQSSEWNIALRRQVPNAFLEAIDDLNTGSLRYHWLHYLPCNEVSPFFSSTRNEILMELSERPVLRSCSNHPEKPISLTYVPLEFRDDTGTPLARELDSSIASKYLCPHYPESEIVALSQIGVKEQLSEGFVADLKLLSKSYSSKSEEWHSRLAKALLPHMHLGECQKAIRSLRIIPLQDGEWLSAQEGPVYFSKGSRDQNIPSGVKIHMVDPVAMADNSRRQLFERLGIKEFDVFQVCGTIVSRSSNRMAAPSELTRQQLVEQAAYLYKSSWRPSKLVDFWFATSHEGQALGSEIYIEEQAEDGSYQKRIYDLLRTKFAFIHQDYATNIQDANGKWRDWLSASFGVSSIPRLVKCGSLQSELSDEMKLLFAEGDSSDALWLLRKHWHHYSKWIDSEAPSMISMEDKGQLRKALGMLKVKCSDGTLTSLCDTFLPLLDSEVESHPGFCILCIEEPTSSKWSFLEYCGVAIRADIRYYVRCLERLRTLEVNNHLVKHVYEQIQARYNANEAVDTSLFCAQNLFYLPSDHATSDKSLAWLDVYKAAKRLSDFEARYPTCTELFRSLFLPRSSDLDQLVGRATLISDSDRLCDIYQIFRDLSKVIQGLSGREARAATKPLTLCHIFPIIKPGRCDSNEFDYLALPSETGIYLGDRQHLMDSFRGKIHLLAFTSEQLLGIGALLSLLNVNWSQLSKVVRSEAKPRGRLNVHRGYTNYVRRRSPFIQSLVPESDPNREAICAKIANAEAIVTSIIDKFYTIKPGGAEEIRGRKSQATVTSSVTSHNLRLFVTQDCITENSLNIELVQSISESCQIKEATPLLLLSVIFSDIDIEQVRIAFMQHGLHVNLPSSHLGLSASRVRKRRYAGSVAETHAISSPFIERKDRFKKPNGLEYDESLNRLRGLYMDSFESGWSHHPHKRLKHYHEGIQSMPFLSVIQSDTVFQEHHPYDLGEGEHVQGDERLKLQYIGETIAGLLFETILGPKYKPSLHWTSSLRMRAGYGPLKGKNDTPTFRLTAGLMSDVLKYAERRNVAYRGSAKVEYYIETVVATRCKTKPFMLQTDQLERMRRYGREKSSKCVSLLMHISNIYVDPTISLYIDPWQLLTSDKMVFTGNAPLEAVIMQGTPADKTLTNFPEFPHHDYKYGRLVGKDIRLLSLLPSARKDDSLRAVVAHIPLLNAGNYRALSYVWGSDARSSFLQTPAGRLHITSSLSSALRHLRREDEPLTLWVDAVCINQDNTKEKGSQIKLLPHVFRNAMSTLVFLGEDTMNDHAMEALMQIKAKANQSEVADDLRWHAESTEQIQQNNDTAQPSPNGSNTGQDESWPKILPPIPNSCVDRTIPPPDARIWEDINRLFRNPWFQRIWVVQEVVAASSVRVLCGNWVVEWNDLLSAIQIIDYEFCISSEYSTLKTSWDNFLAIASYRENESMMIRVAFIELLESFRHAKSTKTRDRFFALGGFAADSTNPAFQPDYDAPFRKIVVRFAKAFIEQGKILLLLYRAGLTAESEHGTAGFPSWIPDWTVPKPPCLWESSHRGVDFAASWKNEPSHKYVPSRKHPDAIAVAECEIDSVKAVTTASCTLDQLREYFCQVDEMVQGLEKSPYVDEEELKWQVPVAGAKHPRTTPDIETDLYTSYKVLRSILASSNPTTDSKSCEASENYKRALFECLEGWRFFVTNNDYVGVGPDSTEKGDNVVIFDGSAVPFLVRKLKDLGDRVMCRLVGECYVHGLMNGEAKNLNRNEGWVYLC